MTENLARHAITDAMVSPVSLNTEGYVKASFTFSSDFIGFQGHFPGYPLLPAFIQVLMTLVTVDQWMAKPFMLTKLDNAKFQKEIKPGDTITVIWKENKDKPFFTYSARLIRGPDVVSSFTVTCVEKGIHQ